MKRLALLAIMALPFVIFEQRTIKDFMDENYDVIWFCLDFTKARMIDRKETSHLIPQPSLKSQCFFSDSEVRCNSNAIGN
jgi:hypothetical protein